MRKYSLLVFCVVFWVSSAVADIKRYDVPIGDAPSRGPEDAPITMIEFLDFQ